MPRNENMNNGNGHLVKQIIKLLRRIRHNPEVTLSELRRVIDTPEAITEAERRGYCCVKRLDNNRYWISVTANGWNFMATHN